MHRIWTTISYNLTTCSNTKYQKELLFKIGYKSSLINFPSLHISVFSFLVQCHVKQIKIQLTSIHKPILSLFLPFLSLWGKHYHEKKQQKKESWKKFWLEASVSNLKNMQRFFALSDSIKYPSCNTVHISNVLDNTFWRINKQENPHLVLVHEHVTLNKQLQAECTDSRHWALPVYRLL